MNENDMINIEFINNTIFKNNEIVFKSRYPIEKIFDVSNLERVVIIIKDEYYDNVLCFNYDGKTVIENCQMLCMLDNRTKSGK